MIAVALLKPAAQRAGRREFAAPPTGQPPGDLKVEQIGSSVVAHEHVLAFFQIDIGHVLGMNSLNEGAQTRMEIVGNSFSAAQGVSLDVLAD